MDKRAGGWEAVGGLTVQAVAESEMTQHTRKGMGLKKKIIYFFLKDNCFTEF